LKILVLVCIWQSKRSISDIHISSNVPENKLKQKALLSSPAFKINTYVDPRRKKYLKIAGIDALKSLKNFLAAGSLIFALASCE